MPFREGNIPWNKGMLCPEISERLRGHTVSKEQRQKLREKNKGNTYNLGKHHTDETKRKMSGANSYNWKGGITPLNDKIRHSFEYRQWRSDIFTRDEFTCQECGQIGGGLNAHHIRPFSSILQKYEIVTIEEALRCEELWNINNGITLCKECHRKVI